jgi:hypothetical protein
MANNVFLPPSPVSPPFLLISAITRAPKAVVTVTTTNTYVEGQLCYFSIPFTYGMFQLNGKTGKIVSITGLNFTMDIDSSQFDTFVIPSFGQEQPASLCSAGSRNIYNNTTVPFHALDGSVGN